MQQPRGVTKLVETITAAGLGSLLTAYRRHAHEHHGGTPHVGLHQDDAHGRDAETGAHRQMRRSLAESQAEKLTAELPDDGAAEHRGSERAGERSGERGGERVGLPVTGTVILGAGAHGGPVLDPPEGPEILSLDEEIEAEPITKDYALAVTEVALEDGMRKADNLAQVIAFAHDDMRANPHELISDDAVDADWFSRWRREAENVSHSEIQQLWGRVLATEIRVPGVLHLQTLDFIRNISVADSEIIARTLQLAIDHQIILDDEDTLRDCGVSDDDLALLEDMGVISTGGEHHGIICSLSETTPARSLSLAGTACLIISTEDPPKDMHLQGIRLTRTGRDLMNLAALENPPAAYVWKVADAIKAKGCEVSLAQRAVLADGSIDYLDAQAL